MIKIKCINPYYKSTLHPKHILYERAVWTKKKVTDGRTEQQLVYNIPEFSLGSEGIIGFF